MSEPGLTLRADVAAFPLVDHIVLRVSGQSPLGLLHDTTSQDLAALRPGHGALTCLLNEKGRVRAEVRVLPLAAGDVLLDGPAAGRAALLGWLGRVAPLAGCTVEDESERWEILAVRGPEAARALVAVAAPLPQGEHQFVERDGIVVVRVAWGPPGFDVLAPAGRMPAVAAASADAGALDAARIEAGRPLFGLDISEDVLVNETPLLERAVAPEKGCYPGQESVARVRNLGRVRRRLVRLRIASGPAPRPGERVLAVGDDVGLVTSAARTGDGAVALAMLRADVETGATVTVRGARAVVESLG